MRKRTRPPARGVALVMACARMVGLIPADTDAGPRPYPGPAPAVRFCGRAVRGLGFLMVRVPRDRVPASPWPSTVPATATLGQVRLDLYRFCCGGPRVLELFLGVHETMRGGDRVRTVYWAEAVA